MKTIKIYDADADTLIARAGELGVTPADLASMIFRDHFAGSHEDCDARAETTPERPCNPDPRPVSGKGPLLTPKELAAHFKTTRSTVLAWYHDGTIPAEVAVGKVYRFDLERVCAALARGASLPMLKAIEQTDRDGRARADVAKLIAELDRERKGRRKGSGENPHELMVPTY
jgi:excisionase family DNA binding protein